MTAALETTTESPTPDDTVRYASWPARAGALTLDFLTAVAVIATMTLLAIAAPLRSWAWWVFVAVVVVVAVAMLVNRVLLPTTTGWTIGRAVFGIRVVRADGQPARSHQLLLRDLAHVLDTAALFIGWLWPLWDGHHRTFADLLLRSEVRVVEASPKNVRRIAAIVLIAAAVASAAGSGLGYLQVYRQDRAVEQARSQIAEQGPRIVEQMLSYGTDTIVDDFARAQSLTTDGYRPQLVAQQQSVQKSGVVSNEYWAVSSAVLSVSADQAAMLLALQGQRGADPKNVKFITATVRADFEKSGDTWRVSALTVLKKPNMPGAGG
jgi:Mce-associated membrane protein